MVEPSQTPVARFAIAALIMARCHELGLSRARLVQLAGYKREPKGIRRLYALMAGDCETTRTLIGGLPAALNLPPDMISATIEQTRQQMAAEERRAGEQAEAQWRATFEPHAIILTERRIPRPMFLAAVIGVERLLRIDFNANAKPASFVSLAVEGVKQKRAQWGSNGGALPGYGAPTGIIVNYAPDWAVKFDLAGVPQEAFAAAYRVGQVQLLLKGRPIPAGVLPQVASGLIS
jgi:hypothetical protein